MAKVIPFKALRYSDKVDISKVVAPPYDIISPAEQDMFYETTPYNVIRLEYGKEIPTDSDSDNKYTRAREYLNKWIEDGILKLDENPGFYIYEQLFTLPSGEEKKLRGIMGLVELSPFSDGIVLPHEETLSKAKTDRFNLMSETFCNFSPIYSLYIDSESLIKNEIDAKTKKDPDISFTSYEGLTQNLWIIQNDKISELFADKKLFIADGHHRYETAVNFKNSHSECSYVLMFMVGLEDDGLAVFPTHRMLSNLANFDETQTIAKLRKNFEIEKHSYTENLEITNMLAQNIELPTFAMYTGGSYYYKLTLRDKSTMDSVFPENSEAYRGLDVNVLHALILDEIFGIDKANMSDQKNLTYTKILDEAIGEVQSGAQQCSFLLNATKVREIKDISLAGEKMPQKSTYFWPKLTTGIVMNKF